MIDPVDADLNRELARIEAENAEDEQLDKEVYELLYKSTDKDKARFVDWIIRSDTTTSYVLGEAARDYIKEKKEND